MPDVTRSFIVENGVLIETLHDIQTGQSISKEMRQTDVLAMGRAFFEAALAYFRELERGG